MKDSEKIDEIKERIAALPDRSDDGIDLRHAKSMAIGGLESAKNLILTVYKLAE